MIKRRKTAQIAPKVMVELLVAEGVTHAGWYGPKALERRFNEVTGNFMNGGFRDMQFSDTQKRGYLPGDLRNRKPRPTGQQSRKMWWEDLGL